MIFSEAEGLVEFLRGALPYYAVIFLPIFIILSPFDPVNGVAEFTVYRMQQYDLQGTQYGCRNAILNMEALTLDAGHIGRRCVLVRFADLSSEKFRELSSQGVGGILILLPKSFSELRPQERQFMIDTEQSMMEEETIIPVYFAVETPELTEIYNSISVSNYVGSGKSSVLKEMVQMVSANGFQMVVNAAQPKAVSDAQISNIHGKLPGVGVEEHLPAIVIVAHYDTSGISPALAHGVDSNASGVAALLELARIFSQLYSISKTHAKYNLLFLISGGAKLNYQGTKRWIEDSLESTEGGSLQDAIYTLCLDSLGSTNDLYIHVSKPPKEGSTGALLVEELKYISESLDPPLKFDMIHKKINLADEMLAWEHERFSIRRLAAFTLSHYNSNKYAQMSSILDTRDAVSIKDLTRKVKVIAESLARTIYNFTDVGKPEIFEGSLEINEEHLGAWLDFLSSHPRGIPLMVGSTKHVVVSSLEQALSKYIKEVKVTYVKADKRDPEFVFYDVTSATMNAYSVKPAIFDLVLTAVVIIYLGIFYVALQNFYFVPQILRRFSGQAKMKSS